MTIALRKRVEQDKEVIIICDMTAMNGVYKGKIL